MIIAQSSQEAEFPAINTIEDTLELFWRTTALDDPVYISSDLEAEHEINFCALLSHNIPDTATIKAIGADDDAFAGDDVVEETIGWASGDIFHFFSVWQTKRYWKIEISGVANGEGYVEIATIVLGKYFEPNRNFNFGYDEGREDFSTFEYSDSMVLHADEKPILSVGKYEFGFLNVASKDEIIVLLDECGIHKGFVVCFDWENADTYSHWVRQIGITQPTNPKLNFWDWAMDIIEVK